MHCNLRPPEPCRPFPALITTPCQVWSRSTYPLPCYSVLLVIHYFTPWLWHLTLRPCPFTFDLWPWTFAVYRLWCDETLTKFERNRAIRGGVIAISVFDLMSLNIALCVALSAGIIFTKLDIRQLIRAWIIAFLCWCVMLRCDLDL